MTIQSTKLLTSLPSNPNELIPILARRVERLPAGGLKLRKLSGIETVDDFRRSVETETPGIYLPVSDRIRTASEGSPLARPIQIGPYTSRNSVYQNAIEGWDGKDDGNVSPAILRRYARLAKSGVGILSIEATAVQEDGRANRRQLCLTKETAASFKMLYDHILKIHEQTFGTNEGFIIVLQLTHSGRYSHLLPLLACNIPVIDKRKNGPVVDDDYMQRLKESYVEAAKIAYAIGIRVIDLKACHGYFMHETFSAFTRKGKYGGMDLRQRTKFYEEVVKAIKEECPGMVIISRLSAIDCIPFHADINNPGPQGFGYGVPDDWRDPHMMFGLNHHDPQEVDIREAVELAEIMHNELGLPMINVSAFCPYTNPHASRPGFYAAKTEVAYDVPEHPYIGLARFLAAAKIIKEYVPGIKVVSTGGSVLQRFFVPYGEGVVEEGFADAFGVGRQNLANPNVIRQALFGEAINHDIDCQGFLDCIANPRRGGRSLCWPFDKDPYPGPDDPPADQHEEFKALQAHKRELTAKNRARRETKK